MRAAEFVAGLEALGIVHERTLPYSPYAQSLDMRSTGVTTRSTRAAAAGTAAHNYPLVSCRMSSSSALNRPVRSFGGIIASTIESFSVGSARR